MSPTLRVNAPKMRQPQLALYCANFSLLKRPFEYFDKIYLLMYFHCKRSVLKLIHFFSREDRSFTVQKFQKFQKFKNWKIQKIKSVFSVRTDLLQLIVFECLENPWIKNGILGIFGIFTIFEFLDCKRSVLLNKINSLFPWGQIFYSENKSLIKFGNNSNCRVTCEGKKSDLWVEMIWLVDWRLSWLRLNQMRKAFSHSWKKS